MECSRNTGMALMGGLGLGIGLAILMDPARGRRRRALVKDKAASLMHHSQDAMGKVARDAKNRVRGIAAEARHMFESEETPNDQVLVARVRSKLGRSVSHPSAINVMADKGKVMIAGPVLADEADSAISAISKISGVREIDNRLEIHQEADIPALQGGSHREERHEWMQSSWSPAIRFVAVVWGTGMIVYGLGRRDGIGAAAGLMGACCLARGATNRELRSMLPARSHEDDDYYYLVAEDIEVSRS